MRSSYVKRTLPSVNAERSTPQCVIYSSLSRDAQRYVDSVAAMGFDLTDVATAVNKLGIDDKLVQKLSALICFAMFMKFALSLLLVG